jgi:hypothetical protein
MQLAPCNFPAKIFYLNFSSMTDADKTIVTESLLCAKILLEVIFVGIHGNAHRQVSKPS